MKVNQKRYAPAKIITAALSGIRTLQLPETAKKKEELPGKGKLNAQISNIIYDYLGKNGIKTHLIKIIDETTVLVKKAEIIMVEVIIRNIAAGGK